MPQFFDPKTGAALPDMSPEQAAQAYTSGTAAIDRSHGPVTLRGKDGGYYSFDPSKLPEVFAKYGDSYSFLSPQEELQRRVHREEKSKGVTGSLEEAGSSALNQALFGAPEAFAEAGLSEKELQEREARQEEHKTARVLGGIAGAGATMLAGGELFKGAELAGEGVAHALLPATAAAEASLGAKMAGKALSYATQGAIFSAPQATIEATVGQNPKKAAETLAWGIGLGGLLGGGAELFSGSLRSGASKLAESTIGSQAAAGRMDEFANRTAVKALGASKSQLNNLSEERIQELGDYLHQNGLLQPGMSRQDIGETVEMARKIEGGRMGEAIQKLDGYLENHANEKAMPSFDSEGFDASEKVVDKAIKPGDISQAIKYGVDLKPREMQALTPQQIERGLQNGTYTVNPDGTFHLQGLWSSDLEMPIHADRARAVEQLMASADKIEQMELGGQKIVSFADAQKFASQLRRKWGLAIDKSLNEGGVSGMRMVTPLDDAKADAYFLVRHVLHSAADDVAIAAKDPKLVGELADAKRNYSMLSKLEEFAANLDRQDAANKGLFGLTDTIHMGQGPMGHIAGGIGAGIGGALGGGVGAMVGHAVGKVAGMPLDYLMKHWLEDKGLVILSHLAKRVANEGPEVWGNVITKDAQARLAASMQTIQDTMKKVAIEGIQATKSATKEHMQHLLGSTSGLTSDQAHDKLGRRLGDVATDPQTLLAATSTMSAPFAAAYGPLGEAYQEQLARTISYLHQSFPKGPAPVPFSTQTWNASPQEKLAFHDKAEVAVNPMRAIAHIATGTLSDDHVASLNALYPEVKDEMARSILQTAALYPNLKLPPAAQASVSKLLEWPIDPLMQAPMVQQLQTQYRRAPAQGTPGQGTSPKQTRVRGKVDMPSTASAFAATQGPSAVE